MLSKKNNITNSTVFELVNDLLDQLTKTEKRIVHVLLSNYPMNGLETIANLAAMAETSAPSVLRFTRKLGFKGYIDFQASLRSEIKERLSTPLQKEMSEIDFDTVSLDSSILRLNEAFNSNLNESIMHIPTREIECLLELLKDQKVRFYFLGGRLTNALALYFYNQMHAVRPNVNYISGDESVWPEYLIDINEGDVVCLFDIRNYQMGLHQFANRAVKRKAQLILFTDQWLSPISHLTQHVFALRTNVPSKWDSVVSIIALLDIIISIYTQRNWSTDVQQRIIMLNKLGSIA